MARLRNGGGGLPMSCGWKQGMERRFLLGNYEIGCVPRCHIAHSSGFLPLLLHLLAVQALFRDNYA